jgi:hypothetical protein
VSSAVCIAQTLHLCLHVHCSAFSGWASNLIANLDPTTLLFEDDEDYDYPGRYVCMLQSKDVTVF